MKLFAKGVMWAMLAAMALILASCGGGGGVSSDNTTGVYIGAAVSMSATPTYYGAVIVSTDGTGTTPITDAMVTMNGVALTYNPTYKDYINSSVVPDASGNFKLVVIAKGATYTATESIFTSVPVLTVPNPFTATAPNTISWTAPGGAPIGGSSMSYHFEITQQTTHAQVFAPGSVTSLSINIPANTLAANGYTANVFAQRWGTQIANAVTGSSLSMFAFAQQVNFSAQ